MLARGLFIVQLVEALIYLLVARLILPGTGWLVAVLLVVAAVLVLRLILVLYGFIVARVPLTPFADWVTAFSSEYVALIRLYFGDHLFERWLSGRRRQPEIATGTPVVFVPGFLCNAGLWRATRKRLAGRLDAPFFSLNLEPPFADIDVLTEQLAALVDRIRPDGGAVMIVGHSMGGLVARRYALNAPDRVAKIVTLGTPHNGTRLARFMLGTNVRQMRIGSEWLTALAAEEASRPTGGPRASLRTRHDSIVAPQDSAELPGADNFEVHGIGHLAMAYSSVCHDWVTEKLSESQAGTARRDASPAHVDAGAPP